MSFTGAADRVDTSGGFGQGETRPQAFTGLDGKGYLIGRTQDRIIEIADISDPDTSTYVSAIIGNPNSMASHNGSLYVFIGKDLIRFDTPFSATDTGTDIFTIDQVPRALTSDGTNLYYIHQLSTLNFLYRIDDLDGTPTVTNTGEIGNGANIRGLVWHDGFFWGVDATTDKLVKITLADVGSGEDHIIENVGSYSQFVGPLTNPQGFGVVNGVGYVSALDNDGSLWELRDFKFTTDIDDQEWTVGTAVSVSAPATEDGATPITYAISPALPAGVTLDTSTGGISGTPTATTDATDYTLTATDDNEIEATTTFSASVAASGGIADTAPAAPTALSITVTATGAAVSFTAGSDGGQAVTDTEYRIQEGASIDDDTDWTSTGETDTDFEIDSLSKGTQYAIEIRQVNSIGNGTKSSLSTFTTDTTTPDAPQNLTFSTTQTTIIAEWDAPTDNGGDTIDRYDIRIDGGSWINAGTDLEHTFSSLTANTEYDIDVAAVNSEGRGTELSGSVTTDSVSITTPGAPQNLTFATTHNSITAEWTAPSSNGGASLSRYDVRIDNGSWIDAGLDLEHTFSSLDPNTEYDIDVAAVNSEGRGTVVSGASTTDATTPTAPQNLTFTTDHESIEADWDAPSSTGGETITRYDVRIDSGSWINAGTNRNHVFSALDPNTQYTIEVAAVNSEGRGAILSATETTDSTTPDAPENLTFTATENSITAMWDAPAEDGGENITRYDIRIDNGSWINAGTDREHTFETLTADTEYDIDVAAVNSEGRGTTLSGTKRTAEEPDAVLTLSIDHEDRLHGEVATVTLASNKDITGLTASDFDVTTGATKGTLTDNGDNTWTLPITAPSTGEGTITISLDEDVVSPGNNAVSVSFNYTAEALPDTPENITAVQVQNKTIVRWDEPEDSGSSDLVRYELRLNSEAWIQGSLEKMYTFLDLPIGDHTIEVAAVNGEDRGNIAEITHTVRFEASETEEKETYTFTTRDGQNLSQILHQEYNYVDSELLKEVLNLNPELGAKPLVLQIGTNITLPVKEPPVIQTIPVINLWD